MNLDELRRSSKAALTVTDVARLLELDERTVRRACEDGDLPSIRIGRRLLVPTAPLLALLGAAPDLDGAGPARPAATATNEAAKEPRHDHVGTGGLRSA